MRIISVSGCIQLVSWVPLISYTIKAHVGAYQRGNMGGRARAHLCTAIFVRVQLYRHFPVSLPDLISCGSTLYTKRLRAEAVDCTPATTERILVDPDDMLYSLTPSLLLVFRHGCWDYHCSPDTNRNPVCRQRLQPHHRLQLVRLFFVSCHGAYC
jgi:hypothetical protein